MNECDTIDHDSCRASEQSAAGSEMYRLERVDVEKYEI